MKAFDVRNLSKSYRNFSLRNITLSLEEGRIMGMVGANGAGKTTLLKSMLNLVQPDSGAVFINGSDLYSHEREIKQSTGFVSGGADYYPNVRVKKLTGITRRFYSSWDEQQYMHLIKQFEIDDSKKIRELSAGMKVKYALAVALSHHARLLILDEPTSGLDPSTRDEIRIVFRKFVDDGKHSILYSTHITSDLEKTADCIAYIKDGTLYADEELKTFEQQYMLVSGSADMLTARLKEHLTGLRTDGSGFEGMINATDAGLASGLDVQNPSLEDIMIHIERKK